MFYYFENHIKHIETGSHDDMVILILVPDDAQRRAILQ